MPFFKITYNDKYRFATLHHYGCVMHCPVCSYKLRSGANGVPGQSFPRPSSFLDIPTIQTALRSVPIDKVYFMGGEPTIARELPALLDFAKNTLKVNTYLGHTAGWRIPVENLDGANVGLKAWDEQVHLTYTGRKKQDIFPSFANAAAAGLEMKANVVYVPGLVDQDQVQAIAQWIAGVNLDIPLHIMGYIPVPGQPYARPTVEQMQEVVGQCRRHLNHVAYSHLSSQEALDLTARDDRFAVRAIA